MKTFLILAIFLLAGCGPSSNKTCTFVFTDERQVIGTKCGPNEVLIGVVPPTTLICVKASALCPKD